MPCCGYCGQPFPDAEPGDVKNYPEDGIVAVFFECDACSITKEDGTVIKKESIFYYKPMRK